MLDIFGGGTQAGGGGQVDSLCSPMRPALLVGI